MKKKKGFLLVSAVLLLWATVSFAAQPAQPVYQMSLRVIQATGEIDMRSFQVPPTEPTMTQEEFIDAVSALNPTAQFSRVYTLSATTLAGFPASLAVTDEEATVSATMTPTPVDEGIRVATQCVADSGTRKFECQTTVLLKEGEGLLVGGVNSTDGIRLITLSASTVAPKPEEVTQ